VKKRFHQNVAMAIAMAVTTCVPSAASSERRGAVGVTMVPSATTAGESFLTDDGWMVKIERVTIFVMLTAIEANATRGEPAEGLYLWKAEERTELILRAVGAGPRTVHVELQGEGQFAIEGAPPSFYTNMDVDPALEGRFRLPPDGLEGVERDVGPTTPHVGVIVAGRAEKGGRVIALDLSLSGRHSQVRQDIEVRADTITSMEFDVRVERLFVVDPETEATGFEEIADADRDGDGKVTGGELRELTVVRGEEEIDALEWLARQTAEIVAPR
jgi:hypothetical protein